jgi:hypothetical protein
VVMKAAAKPEAILALWVSLSCVSFMDHAWHAQAKPVFSSLQRWKVYCNMFWFYLANSV